MSSRLIPFAIALGVFALDRLTKAVIERFVSPWDVHVVVPGLFQIIHAENRGAAFSMFADSSGPVRTAVLVGLAAVVLVIIAHFLWTSASRLSGEHWSLRLGLSLVLGGALGNVYDRVVRGAVTDFLDVYVGDLHWPTFNVADSAITAGAALMLLSMWLGRRREAVRTEHVSKTD